MVPPSQNFYNGGKQIAEGKSPSKLKLTAEEEKSIMEELSLQNLEKNLMSNLPSDVIDQP